MAIQFNLNALSRFSNVNFGDNDAIANLDGGNGLVQNEKLGFILTRKFRSSTAEKQNNAVRTELLKALGKAFGLNDGVAVNNGKTTFTDQFMNRLEEILGPAFKRGDFGIKNGVVDSGKPLTQRRIQAIVKAARAKGEAVAYDGTTYLAKVDYIKGWIKGKGGLDGAAKRAALNFFDVKIRNTIDFLDKEFEGLSYVKVGGDNTAFKKYIKNKTGLDIDIAKITSDLHAKNAIRDAALDNDRIVNIDDIKDIEDKTFAPVKEKVGEILKALVKKSVDLFIHTTESKHGEGYKSVIDVVSKEDKGVNEILSSLNGVSEVQGKIDQYWEKKETQPDEESVSEFEEANDSYLEE